LYNPKRFRFLFETKTKTISDPDPEKKFSNPKSTSPKISPDLTRLRPTTLFNEGEKMKNAVLRIRIGFNADPDTERDPHPRF
jgi:hypothetical protein